VLYATGLLSALVAPNPIPLVAVTLKVYTTSATISVTVIGDAAPALVNRLDALVALYCVIALPLLAGALNATETVV
jgi:hypothetical protein